MEEIFIASTDVSPEIVFKPSKKIFTIKGSSRPESPSQFYAPVLQWIDAYGTKHLNNASVVFDLDYFNTPSARSLRNLFTKLESLYASGVKLSVLWIVLDETSIDESELEFAHDISLPISYKKK